MPPDNPFQNTFHYRFYTTKYTQIPSLYRIHTNALPNHGGAFLFPYLCGVFEARGTLPSVNNGDTNHYETQHKEYAHTWQQRDADNDAVARSRGKRGVLRAGRQAVPAPLCRAGRQDHRAAAPPPPTVRRRGERRHHLSQSALAQTLRTTVDRARRLPPHEPLQLHRPPLPRPPLIAVGHLFSANCRGTFILR